MVNLPLASDQPEVDAKDWHIIVRFGKAVPKKCQGPALLHMEKTLRAAGFPVEVFKETMPDDLKRRRDMTPEQRATLGESS